MNRRQFLAGAAATTLGIEWLSTEADAQTVDPRAKLSCPSEPKGAVQWNSYVLADFGNGSYKVYGFAGVDARVAVDCDQKTSYEATAQARIASVIKQSGKTPVAVYLDLWPDTIENHGPTWQAASQGATANGTRLGHAGDRVPENVLQEVHRKSPHLERAIRTMLANN